MATGADDGDKTEEPSEKKLRDARDRGEVAKSKDLTATAGLAVWLLLGSLSVGWAAQRLAALMAALPAALDLPFEAAAASLSAQALDTLLALSAAAMVPVLAVGVLVEFLQVGPVFSTDKLAFKPEGLNPVQGLQRMVSMDNLVEVVKSLLKTAAVGLVGWHCAMALPARLVGLAWSRRPESAGDALWATARPLLGWTVAVFALLAVLDARHQAWRFMKKMRMSRHELKQEHKEQEGDPAIKAQRKQLGEAWIREATEAARRASALIVNPTHIAIALHYDREACPVPVLAAKGEDRVALAMRQAAEEAGVPILRNIPLARELMARGEAGQWVPADLFDVIAEVILWAREVRDGPSGSEAAGTGREPPGEDLTPCAARPHALHNPPA